MEPIRLDRRSVLAVIAGGVAVGRWLTADDRLVVATAETHVVSGAEVYSRADNGGEVRAGPGDEVQV